MIPWTTLERARTTDGSDIVLAQRGHQFAIRVDGQVLMNSDSNGSEQKLARQGCVGLREVKGARVLVGGLGMGFTARAALDELGPDARVDVVELVGAVTRWNRELIGHLAGAPLTDERVAVIEGDVADVIAKARDAYDAILLDVDNGPAAVTTFSNNRLYTLAGLKSSLAALRPGGVLAVWSAFEADGFTNRLKQAGASVEVKRVRAHGSSGQRHVIWLARVGPVWAPGRR
jgi:spermidine synthase